MAELSEGTFVGPYRIVRLLGSGGMGAVYEGVHDAIERKVAIKTLHTHMATNSEFSKRFFNEARAVNRVSHPGLVQVSDYGQLPDKTAYIVMEYLQGETLSDKLHAAGGKLALDVAINLAAQLAQALEAAHSKGIIHRDLKPQNIMVVHDPQIPGGQRTKILDFGIAKLAEGTATGQVQTETGALLGTPRYMSPEQCKGAALVDARSDVYSLGIMLYEMVSGRPPLPGNTVAEIVAQHLFQTPPPLMEVAPGIPSSVSGLVQRMLIKDRDTRPTMAEITSALAAIAEELGISSIRSGWESSRSSRTRSQRGTRWLEGRWLVLGIIAGFGILGTGTYIRLHERQRPVVKNQPALPKMMFMEITSKPQGADILRKSDGYLLGKTPWTWQAPQEASKLELQIRLTGFEPIEVVLDPKNPTSPHADLKEKVPLATRPREPGPPTKAPNPRVQKLTKTPTSPIKESASSVPRAQPAKRNDDGFEPVH